MHPVVLFLGVEGLGVFEEKVGWSSENSVALLSLRKAPSTGGQAVCVYSCPFELSFGNDIIIPSSAPVSMTSGPFIDAGTHALLDGHPATHTRTRTRTRTRTHTHTHTHTAFPTANTGVSPNGHISDKVRPVWPQCDGTWKSPMEWLKYKNTTKYMQILSGDLHKYTPGHIHVQYAQ